MNVSVYQLQTTIRNVNIKYVKVFLEIEKFERFEKFFIAVKQQDKMKETKFQGLINFRVNK